MEIKSTIGETYAKKLSGIFRKYDDTKPKVDVNATQPIKKEELVTVERWMVYSFTLPIKVSKKLAFGFDSKSDALKFIEDHCIRKNDSGEVVEQTLKLDGVEYVVKYDVIRESVEQVNLYYNDPEITIIGNDKTEVLKAYLS